MVRRNLGLPHRLISKNFNCVIWVKLFKYELGTSPNEYILQQRIKRAKELLKENQSIKEVAFATGFSDTNHLIKTFKTFEGITPKNYQRNLFSEYKIVS